MLSLVDNKSNEEKADDGGGAVEPEKAQTAMHDDPSESHHNEAADQTEQKANASSESNYDEEDEQEEQELKCPSCPGIIEFCIGRKIKCEECHAEFHSFWWCVGKCKKTWCRQCATEAHLAAMLVDSLDQGADRESAPP